MNGKTTETNMLKIADDIKAALSSEASSLDPQQKTAAKAYNICIGILNQASKMVSMKFSDKSYDEKYYSVRESRVFNNPNGSYFLEYKSWYDNEMNSDSKEAFLVYAHAVQMIRTAFIDKKKAELKKANEFGQTEQIFECKMIIDALQDLMEKWKAMWEAEKGNING